MNKPELSYARLEASLDAKIERYFDTLDTDPDVLKRLLADKRSENKGRGNGTFVMPNSRCRER
jgi:integrase/recombinase XerC